MPVLHAARIVQPGHFSSPAKPPPGAPPVLYELRSYQLTHGWGAVPTWVDAFAQGVPSKIDAAADADPDAVPTLVFAGYSEVGPMNCTMELWRHASSSACTRSALVHFSSSFGRSFIILLLNPSTGRERRHVWQHPGVHLLQKLPRLPSTLPCPTFNP